MFPTKSQWGKWSLPSKLTAVGTYVGVLSFLLYLGNSALNFGKIDSSENQQIESGSGLTINGEELAYQTSLTKYSKLKKGKHKFFSIYASLVYDKDLPEQ